ncbi:MAG: hypothetical protein HY827_04620 [Actinobacteria bacterium]|nr:hypothetical protein [Actinomycetota bacterium]
MQTRLFRNRRRALGDHEPDLARHAVLADYRIEGDVGLPQIDEIYERLGYRKRLDDGLLVHVGGTIDDAIAYMSVWQNDSLSAASWRQKRQVIDEVLKRADPDPVVDRRSHSVHRLIVGADLSEFRAGLAVSDPECVGYVIDLPNADVKLYERVIARMDFPGQFPAGLLIHAVGQVEDVLRITSIWRHAGQSRRFLEDRLMPALVSVVRERGVFPEIRPVELKVHYLAVADALADA